MVQIVRRGPVNYVIVEDATTRTSVQRRADDAWGHRIAASKLGISYDEYRAQIERGLKWCSGHHAWMPRSAFGPNARHRDGLMPVCRECNNAASRNSRRRQRQEAGS